MDSSPQLIFNFNSKLFNTSILTKKCIILPNFVQKCCSKRILLKSFTLTCYLTAAENLH